MIHRSCALVSPDIEGRQWPSDGRAGIVGADEVKHDSEDQVREGSSEEKDEEHVEIWEDVLCGPCEPRTPHDPGRPTKEEVRRHNIHHWPYRPW